MQVYHVYRNQNSEAHEYAKIAITHGSVVDPSTRFNWTNPDHIGEHCPLFQVSGHNKLQGFVLLHVNCFTDEWKVGAFVRHLLVKKGNPLTHMKTILRKE